MRDSGFSRATAVVALIVTMAAVNAAIGCSGNSHEQDGALPRATQCRIVLLAVDSVAADLGVTSVLLAESTYAPHALLLIDSASDRDHYLDSLRISRTTLSDFKRRNQQAGVQRCNGGEGLKLTLVPDTALRKLADTAHVDNNSWGRRFANGMGIGHTSLVGVGQDGREALVSVGMQCGQLCGGGYLVVAVQDSSGRWLILRAVRTGAS